MLVKLKIYGLIALKLLIKLHVIVGKLLGYVSKYDPALIDLDKGLVIINKDGTSTLAINTNKIPGEKK